MSEQCPPSPPLFPPCAGSSLGKVVSGWAWYKLGSTSTSWARCADKVTVPTAWKRGRP